MRWWTAIMVLLGLTMPAVCQHTTVTAQVQDTNGSLYSNCTGSASFRGQNTTPGAGPYLLNGSVFQTVAALNCDGSGNLTVSLADNNQISPSPSQWAFSICSVSGLTGGPYCFTTLVTITGASQNITSSLQTNAPILPASGSTIVATSISSKAIEKCRFPEQFTPGATADILLNNAIAAVPSTGGCLNWTGFGSGAQSIAAHVSIGGATQPITSIFDPATTWNITQNDSTTDVFCFDNGSALTAFGMVADSVSGFRVQTGAAFRSVMSNCHKDGTQQTAVINGATLVGSSSVTPGKAMLFIQGLSSPSVFQNMSVYQCKGPCLFLTNPPVGSTATIASDISFINDEFGGSPTTSDQPCLLKTDASGGTVGSVHFFGGGCQEAGTALPALAINGNGVNGGMNSINFFGVHYESTPNVPTDDITVADANAISWYSPDISGSTPTDAVWKISQTVGGYTHDIHIRDVICMACSAGTLLVNNTNSGAGRGPQGLFLGSYDYSTIFAVDHVTTEGPDAAYNQAGDATQGVIQLAPFPGGSTDNRSLRIGAAVPTATGVSNGDATKPVVCIDFTGANGVGSSISFSTTSSFGSGCVYQWQITPTGTMQAKNGNGVAVAPGGHYASVSVNKDSTGTCTMTAGACTAIVFTTAYTSAPACQVTWTGTGTCTGILSSNRSTTGLQPKSSVGTDTCQVDYTCTGNPN